MQDDGEWHYRGRYQGVDYTVEWDWEIDRQRIAVVGTFEVENDADVERDFRLSARIDVDPPPHTEAELTSVTFTSVRYDSGGGCIENLGDSDWVYSFRVDDVEEWGGVATPFHMCFSGSGNSGYDETWQDLWAMPPVQESIEIVHTFTLTDGESADLSSLWDYVLNTAVCDGDFNGDGVVDALDLSLLLEAWASNDASGDLNDDGKVDSLDLAVLLVNWGFC